jgi:hypothetical protein
MCLRILRFFGTSSCKRAKTGERRNEETKKVNLLRLVTFLVFLLLF